MTGVLRLNHEEPVRLDRDQLNAMYRELGPIGADRAVNHALEDLAVLLSRAIKQYRAGTLDQLRTTVQGLVSVAQQVGMVTLARVGRDVVELSTTYDAAAFGATMARLERIGEGSLVAVWDLQDMTV